MMMNDEIMYPFNVRMSIAVWLVILIGLLECVGDVVLKHWADGPTEVNRNIIMGTALYAMIGILYGVSLRYGMLSVVSSIWQGVSLLFTFLLATIYFKERPTRSQIGCIALVMLGTVGLIVLS